MEVKEILDDFISRNLFCWTQVLLQFPQLIGKLIRCKRSHDFSKRALLQLMPVMRAALTILRQPRRTCLTNNHDETFEKQYMYVFLHINLLMYIKMIMEKYIMDYKYLLD